MIKRFFVCMLMGLSYPLFASVSPDLSTLSFEMKTLELLIDAHCFSSLISTDHQITITELQNLLNSVDKSCQDDVVLNSKIEYLTNFVTKVRQSKTWGEHIFGASITNSSIQDVLETQAKTNPLLDQSHGLYERNRGLSLWTLPRLSFGMSENVSAEVAPLIPIHMDRDDTSFEPKLYEANVKIGLHSLELQMGRFLYSTGQAKTGSLLMGNEHGPLLGIKLSNNEPVTLPWFFRFFGPVQFNFIWAQLDKNQTFPRSNVVIERLDIKPFKSFEAGFSQVIELGGKGSPKVTFFDGLKEIAGHRVGNIRETNFSNRGFSFDFKFKPKNPIHFEFYNEIYFEDCCGGQWLRDISSLMGVGTLHTINNKKLKLNAEWVRTTEITYRNATFTSGLEDREHVLGNALGPDAMGIYLMGKMYSQKNESVSLDLAWEKRARKELNQHSADIRNVIPGFISPETRYRIKWGYLRQWKESFWVNPVVGYEFVQNVNYGLGNKNNLLFQATAGYKF